VPDPIEEALLHSCERLVVGANHPIVFSGDDSFYVLSGALDLFVQPVTEEKLGKRRLVATAGPGSFIWRGPVLADRPGWRLLGVGRPGTELLRLAGATVPSTVDENALAERFEALVESAAPDGDGRSTSRSTSAATDEPPGSLRLSDARAAFTELVLRVIDDAVDVDIADAERLSSERQRARRRLDRALTDLVDVVDRGVGAVAAPDDGLAQLDLALGRVFAELGVELPERRGLEAGGDAVASRVSAARCRIRVVTLRAGWWKRASVPLLVFSTAGRPLAAIPRRSGHDLYDPGTGATTRLDEPVARGIAERGYAVYPPLPPNAHSPRKLFGSALRHLRGSLGVLFAVGVLAGLVTLVTPLATSLVYNSVLPQGDRKLLADICALLGGATITWGLLVLSQNLVLVRVEGLVQSRLEPGLTDRLLRLPSDFFRRYDTGDLATRADGLEIIHQQLSGAVATSFLTLLFSVFNVALLFAYSTVLAFVALVILVVVIAALVAMNVREIRYQTGIYESTGEIASDVFQMIQGIDKVRVAGAETRLMARWAARYRVQAADIYLAGRIDAWIFALITALPPILALALYGTTVSVLNNDISSGAFMALLTALGQFTAAIAGVALTVGPLFTVIPLWQRLVPILAEPLEETATGDPGPLLGRIEARDVTFDYGGDEGPILQNVTLDVRPGDFVAITGPSGAGKSTLLRLLLGLDHPTSGTILYDGKDLRTLDTSAVRRQFGVVMQGARPLPGEIMSTILGDGPGDEAAAWEAAETAALADDIRQMPMGMHTVIGEGGLAFSGGQLQRMMVARALARKPRVLFFDEATSALDDRSQEAVSRHIEHLDSTRFVIAHRLSTIRQADKIYVLDGGCIVESGTYEELMAADGLFKHLTSRQLV
jgi:NHLM bacteriocin system ABC transporter ATP-binding protein